jgi:acetate kinase
MIIFVINAGSSSIKYQLFNMPEEVLICSGLVERIGFTDAIITHKTFPDGKEQDVRLTCNIPDHAAGLREVGHLLTDDKIGVVKHPDEIGAVGHRVVHGGEHFEKTTLITPEVKETIRRLFPLAPLHNPPNLMVIEVVEKFLPKAKQVAVFDTAFHQTMPEVAFRYAIPDHFYREMEIRAYGFHGTSHKYVSERAAEYLKRQDARIVTIHLGNGCSMAAVRAGRSVDTTLGMGTMNGLVMGTRSGDIDQSVIFHLVNEGGYALPEVYDILYKKSGLLGLAGHSDMRDVIRDMEAGVASAKLVYEMYAYRIKKYIGAYAAVLNGLDAIVFTAGVGENDPAMRELVCKDMDYLGIVMDAEKNRAHSKAIREVNAPDSRVKILVIPTNEELEIARQCYKLLT